MDAVKKKIEESRSQQKAAMRLIGVSVGEPYPLRLAQQRRTTSLKALLQTTILARKESFHADA